MNSLLMGVHLVFLPTLLLLLQHRFMACIAMASILNIKTDQSSLLALKDHITYDLNNILAQNWSIKTPVCNWIGITCGSSHLGVTALNLSYMGLVGTIPPLLGNLCQTDMVRIILFPSGSSQPTGVSPLLEILGVSEVFTSVIFSGGGSLVIGERGVLLVQLVEEEEDILLL
ncbi:hypothetical protein L6164_008648 [Bauhinia variegata]|uniref:Uncharacterized protein n=1 Tax=Bauhinia variegata TaxID=167791 RepID=A0ACB9PHF2_BAUVA|nr:hypothetical protein L6164_008648 [Bauhinia variegata]